MIEGVLMGLIISLVVATQTVFMFTLKIGENSHFDSYFSTGLVQPPTNFPYFLEVFYVALGHVGTLTRWFGFNH